MLSSSHSVSFRRNSHVHKSSNKYKWIYKQTHQCSQWLATVTVGHLELYNINTTIHWHLTSSPSDISRATWQQRSPGALPCAWCTQPTPAASWWQLRQPPPSATPRQPIAVFTHSWPMHTLSCLVTGWVHVSIRKEINATVNSFVENKYRVNRQHELTIVLTLVLSSNISDYLLYKKDNTKCQITPQ